MALSVNMPIWHTFDNTVANQIDYDVLIGGKVIYSGVILPYNAGDRTVRFDMSVIFRSYLDTFYENIINNNVITSMPVVDNIATIQTFIIDSAMNEGGGVPVSYTVVYDYNTSYVSDIGNVRYLNDPIENLVDPRQKVFVTGYNLTGAQAYTASVNGAQTSTVTLTSSQFQMYPIVVGDIADVGDTLTVAMTGANSNMYKVVAPCRNRFCLYYVNKHGGLDALLTTGRSVESWSPTQTDVRLYNDRGNRLDWEQKRINQDIEHRFTLNTGLLSNENAKKIDNLIYSPKVFIHDLEENTITSCLITNTSYTVAEHPYDLVQYTISIKYSQKEFRK